MPDTDTDFVLRETADADTVWVCGYEAGFADLVAELRTRHPHATLVVTGRGSTERWGEEVRAVGADVICSWPVPYAMLSQVLHTRRDAAVE